MSLNKTKKKIYAVETVQEIKEKKKYREISEETGINIPLLSRYFLGKVLPNEEKADKILRIYKSEDKIRQNILNRIKENHDLMNISTDLKLLRDIAFSFKIETHTVLVKEGTGVPFATLIAELCNAKLILIKENENLNLEEYREDAILVDFIIEKMSCIQSIIEKTKVQKVFCVISQGEEIKNIRYIKAFLKIPEDLASARLTKFFRE